MASTNMEVGHAQSLYQPLNTNRREIRLLEILSESPNDKVECKLHTVPFTPETYYVCLSYVWGDPSITEEIIVNGIPRQVTVNLATALRHLKKHWMEIELESDPSLDASKFRLWADAVCINQDDLAERSDQVSMMADIYSSAEMVLAWISSNDGDVAGAFDIFERIFHEVKSDWDARSRSTLSSKLVLGYYGGHAVLEGRLQFPWIFPEDSRLFKNQPTDLQLHDPYSFIIKFCALAFWSRIWIQQELVLAQRLYYISPSHRLSELKCSTAFCTFFVCLKALTETDHRLQNPITRANTTLSLKDQELFHFLLEMRQLTHKRNVFSVDWQLHCLDLPFLNELKATNKLDHVYGLLAVTKMPIFPDYTKPVREVYTEFMQVYVATWKRLQKNSLGSFRPASLREVGCLSYLRTHGVGIRRLHGLPSWAPVFDTEEMSKTLVVDGWDVQKRCVYKTVPELWNHLPIAIAGTSLWAKAIKVQTVKTCYQEPVSADFMCNHLVACFEEFLKIHGKGYLNGKSLLEVLCCTLLLKENCEYDEQGIFYWLLASRQLTTVIALDGSKMRLQPHHEPICDEWHVAGARQEGSRLLSTEDGYIGLAPADVLPGDVVCVLAGCNSLTILRPEGDHYLFVGCCFMIGLMHGEVADLLASGRTKIQFLEIR